MRKIKESEITSTSEMYFKKGTWTHLQAAYTECFEAIMRREFKNYSGTTPYVIYGCVNSGNTTNYVISAGAIFYGGEIYLVDSATFSVGGGQTAVATITTTDFTTDADPVTFSDGSPKYVHNIRKIVIAAGTSGGGTFDYSAVSFYGSSDNFTDITSAISLHANFSSSNKAVRRHDDGTIEVYISATIGSNIAAASTLVSGLPTVNCVVGVFRCRLYKASPAATAIQDVLLLANGSIQNVSLFDTATYDTFDLYLTYKVA